MSRNRSNQTSLRKSRPGPTQEQVHGRPISRRDFISRTLAGSAGALFMPSLFTLAARKLMAADPTCVLPQLNTRTPLICLDLAGGASLAGNNVMVGGAGGQLDFLPNSAQSPNVYQQMGLAPSESPSMLGAAAMRREFGLAFHPSSRFFGGLQAEMILTALRADISLEELQNRVDGVVICNESYDDLSTNYFNPCYWIAKSGSMGLLGAQAANIPGSVSGGHSRAPAESVDPSLQPLIVQTGNGLGENGVASLVDLQTLSTLLGGSSSSVSTSVVDKLLRLQDRLNQNELARFTSMDLSQQAKAILGCSSGQFQMLNSQSSGLLSKLNPLADTSFIEIFPEALGGVRRVNDTDLIPILQGQGRNGAAVAKLVLEGVVGCGTITGFGYDYHGISRRSADLLDEAAGRMVGRLIGAAAAKSKDLMLFVFSDGACFSDGVVEGGETRSRWVADRGPLGSAMLLLYRHNARRDQTPFLKEGHLQKRQIGHFRVMDGKPAVNRTANLVSVDTSILAKAVVANYLALNPAMNSYGRLADEIQRLCGVDPFGAGGMPEYVAFNPIA
jgi:hypothetical protein